MAFTLAFIESWQMTLIVLGLAPLLMIAGVATSRLFLGTGTSKNADPFLDSGTVSQEILMNIRTVLAFPYLITAKTKKFQDELAKGLPIAIQRATASGVTMGVQQFISQGVIYGVGMYFGLRFLVGQLGVPYGSVFGAFLGVVIGGMSAGQVS